MQYEEPNGFTQALLDEIEYENSEDDALEEERMKLHMEKKLKLEDFE